MFDDFITKKVAVIGDVALDIYTEGTVERISPEAPVPVLSFKKRYARLGMAANVAANLRALGAHVEILSVVGDDDYATELMTEIANRNIRTHFEVDQTRPTTTKERILTSQQQIARIDREATNPIGSGITAKLIRSIRALKNIDAFVIQDHAKGVISREIVEELLAKQVPIFCDPNINQPRELYSGVTYITPNKNEAEHLIGFKIKKDMLYSALLTLGTQILHPLITLGEQGIAWLDCNQLAISPAQAREVFDVSGAGDTVIATLTLAIVSGAPLHKAIELANVAAGIVVGKKGTATLTLEELRGS